MKLFFSTLLCIFLFNRNENEFLLLFQNRNYADTSPIQWLAKQQSNNFRLYNSNNKFAKKIFSSLWWIVWSEQNSQLKQFMLNISKLWRKCQLLFSACWDIWQTKCFSDNDHELLSTFSEFYRQLFFFANLIISVIEMSNNKSNC